MLQVRDLDAGYGEAQVLWDVALDVRESEIVAILGANGAGKSTLLGAITGLVPARQGSVVFNGDDITHWSPERIVAHGIGHVPQGRRLFGGLTVLENLLMGAFRRKDGKAIKDDLDRVLTMFPRLAERRDQLAGKLSGGEQQMCAIGRGLMGRPSLLLVDELSLGLAPIVVEHLLEVLASLRKAGTTLLMVEQDVQVALETADRAYVLETGRVALAGSSAQIAGNPHVKTAYLGL